MSKDFESSADMAKAALNVVLDADNTQISTEALSHVAGCFKYIGFW
jgi:hypothetical protein